MLGWVAASPLTASAGSPDEITYGVDLPSRDQKNAKLYEYNYKRDDKAGFLLKLHKNVDIPALTSDGKNLWLGGLKFDRSHVDYLTVDVSGRSPEEIGMEIATGDYGRYKLSFGIQRMGHNFYYDARTLYSGNGSGNLSISDAIQTDIQNTAGTTRDDKLNAYLASSSNLIDMSLRRDKIRFNLERLSDNRPLTWNLFLDQEFRRGSRPYGASFGHGNAVEIPEPIDYGTMNAGVGAEYMDKGTSATFSLYRSRFRNDNAFVKYDNPLIITDSTAGAAAGRNALAPDNTYDNLTLFLSKALEHHTRVTARASLGRMRQDENLLAMTSNTAYDTAVPSFTNLGTTRAGLKVDKRQYEASLAAGLTDNFHVKTSFHYDQHENRSPFFSTPKFLAYDGSVSKSGETTTYVSYIKRTTEAEAEYEISRNMQATFTFEHEVASFRNGSASHEIENVYQLALARRGEFLGSRLVFEHAKKSSVYPNYPKYAAEVPLMRKYYAASRDHDQITAMLDASPTERLSLNFEAVHGVDKYPKSVYGLRSNRRTSLGLDADYRVDEKMSIQAFYNFEYDKTFQRSHAWSSGASTDPHAYPDTYNQSNSWTLGRRDKWRTFGVTVSSILVENVLDVVVMGSVSRVDGMADYDSPGSVLPPTDFQQVDESRSTTIDARLNYRMKAKPGMVSLGYRFDKLRIYDFQYDGVQEVTENSTGSYLGLLNMNTLPKKYGGVHTVYLSLTYPF